MLCLTRFREQLLLPLPLQIIQPKDDNIISFFKIIPCSRKAQAEKMKCVRKLRVVFICTWFSTPGGVLPYVGHIGMCRCEGYGFQAVYSGIGYINQSVWV